LAFISGEGAPLSEQFDVGGVDAMPRNMDDGNVPLSAQYSGEADVVYYGERGHSDFKVIDEVAESIAERILRYLFGGDIECSVSAGGGTLEHAAGWLPGTDYWEDVIGECPSGGKRSSYQVSRVSSIPFLTSIKEVRWLNPDNPEDCRLYVRTRAAPRISVQVDWSIYRQGLLPVGIKRDHYEVEIVTGTPLTNIDRVSWVTDDPRDLRLRIWSEAERPFRWFKAEWRVYSKESRQRKVIDEVPRQALVGTNPDTAKKLTTGRSNCCD